MQPIRRSRNQPYSAWRYAHDPAYKANIDKANRKWYQENKDYWRRYYKLHSKEINQNSKRWLDNMTPDEKKIYRAKDAARKRR